MLPSKPELGLIPWFGRQDDENVEQGDVKGLGVEGGVSFFVTGQGLW